LNGNIRCAATNYLKKFFLEKSLPLLKWAIQYESDYDCMILIIQSLVELNSTESKVLLIDMLKHIKKTKYLDEDKRIENKKFKKVAKKILKEMKGESLAHQTLAEIIINYLTISNLTKKFYSVYFELENGLVRKLDLADVEYEVRGWKSDFKNNIKELSEIKGIEFLKSLTHLYLSNNQISNIEELFKLKNLTHLYLSNNKIKDIENLEYFKDLPNLKYVDISGNPLLENLNSHYFNTNRFGNIKIVLKKLAK
ncbi:MAG: leucine-rich repeat domain-containing protein, partial [Candidatus Odinarchaeota archaeon]